MLVATVREQLAVLVMWTDPAVALKAVSAQCDALLHSYPWLTQK